MILNTQVHISNQKFIINVLQNSLIIIDLFQMWFRLLDFCQKYVRWFHLVTSLPAMLHVCVSELGHKWFRKWPVACLAVEISDEPGIKKQTSIRKLSKLCNFHWRKCAYNYRLQLRRSFVLVGIYQNILIFQRCICTIHLTLHNPSNEQMFKSCGQCISEWTTHTSC